MYLVTREMLQRFSEILQSFMAELQKIKIALAICFGLLLIIAMVYVIEKVKGE